MDYKELFIKKLKEIKKGNFVIVGEYKGSKERTKFRHVVCGHEWETQPNSLLHAKGGPEKGCPECQRIGNSITSEAFPKVFYKRVSSDEFELDISLPYKGQKEPIRVNHLICGSLFTTYWGTFFSNTSCPICRKNIPSSKRKSKEKYREEIFDLYGDEYTLLSDYIHAHEPVLVRHNICGLEFSIRAAHLLSGRECSRCNSSTGEITTRRILTKIGVRFQEQVRFPDCRDKKQLPFDFAIVDEKGSVIGLIEYDGAQHFEPVDYFGGVETYLTGLKHDEIKNSYARLKNIPLLRIPYTLSIEEVEEDVTNFTESLAFSNSDTHKPCNRKGPTTKSVG